MKLKNKLADEHLEKKIGKCPNSSESDAWEWTRIAAYRGYLEGFEKAREMCAMKACKSEYGKGLFISLCHVGENEVPEKKEDIVKTPKTMTNTHYKIQEWMLKELLEGKEVSIGKADGSSVTFSIEKHWMAHTAKIPKPDLQDDDFNYPKMLKDGYDEVYTLLNHTYNSLQNMLLTDELISKGVSKSHIELLKIALKPVIEVLQK